MRFLVLLRATKAFSLQCDSFIHSSPIFLRWTRIASSGPRGAVCGSGSLLVPVLVKAAGLRYKPPERACVHALWGVINHHPAPRGGMGVLRGESLQNIVSETQLF